MAKPVEENYLITIKGTMEQRGDSDTVELMTRGDLVHKENAYYIVYKETETTGYAGCTTTVKVAEDARRVSMTRLGPNSSKKPLVMANTLPITAISSPMMNILSSRRISSSRPSRMALLTVIFFILPHTFRYPQYTYRR